MSHAYSKGVINLKRRALLGVALVSSALSLAAQDAPSAPLPALFQASEPLPLATLEGALPSAPDSRSLAPRRSLAPSSGSPESARHHGASFVFDIEPPWGEARFERFRATYATPGGRAWLERALVRAEPWLDYVRERIDYHGLPAELAWLPVIESEYHPWAVSKSGAVGLWQFMRNSIGGYDMRIDEWTDERRDFMKATEGALRKLAYNHEQLGDWYLALAAYNAGLGAVTRAIASGGTRDYFELCERGFLKPETANYVPKLLAAATVLGYPGRVGIKANWSEARAWERISLEKPVDLSILAEASGVPLADLRAGNAELNYSVTPPDRPYSLKVPASAATQVREALARPDLQLMRFYMYTVKSGDTLSALSRHYDVSVPLILRFNPGLRPELLRIGARVVVPALKDVKPYVAPDAPRDDRAFSGTHIVGKGETLWGIALRYDVRPETLAERNGITLDALIREGQALKVPILE